jgi:hypothetical protein
MPSFFYTLDTDLERRLLIVVQQSCYMKMDTLIDYTSKDLKN